MYLLSVRPPRLRERQRLRMLVGVCDLHFDHRVEQACSAAASVPPRSPCPGHPLPRLLALCRFPLTRRFLMLRGAACGSGVGSAFPWGYINRGVRMCLPGRGVLPPGAASCVAQSHCPDPHVFSTSTGAAGRVSRSLLFTCT